MISFLRRLLVGLYNKFLIIEYIQPVEGTSRPLPMHDQYVWVKLLLPLDRRNGEWVPAQYCRYNKSFMWGSGWYDLTEVSAWAPMTRPQQQARRYPKCAHHYVFLRNIFGDEIIEKGYKRSVWKCCFCQKIEYRNQLHPCSHHDNRSTAPTQQTDR